MKLKFKVQPYQTNAVESVVDCFAGQPMTSGLTYRIDPGRIAQVSVFDEIGQRISKDKVKYDVVTDYAKLMDMVGLASA